MIRGEFSQLLSRTTILAQHMHDVFAPSIMLHVTCAQMLVDAAQMVERARHTSNQRESGHNASTRRRRFSGEADVKAYYVTAKRKFAQALELSEFAVSNSRPSRLKHSN